MDKDKVLALANHHMEQVEALNFLSGKAYYYSARSPASATGTNEDSMAIIPVSESSGVIAVADGIGGHRGGAEASRLAIAGLVDAICDNEVSQSMSLREAILLGIEEGHRRIRSLGLGGGSTLSVVEVYSGQVRFYNVGDSVSSLIGGRGLVKYRTVEHSPVGYGVEAGLIHEKTALEHEDRHMLLNALGMDDLRIDVSGSVELAKRDIILSASDGLTSNIPWSEIVEGVNKGKAEERLPKLIKDATGRMQNKADDVGGPDDLTVVLFFTAL